MTRYAMDEVRRTLIASWDTGAGDVAFTVADLQPSALAQRAVALAGKLSRLSEALWRCYTHPASAADSLEPNTEGWRRQKSREAFAGVIAAIREPNLPHNGLLTVSYDPVVESARQVGRALHAIGDAELTERVVADVSAELEAVEQAERGDLSGRSRQAVVLTREDASPVQVSAAYRVLEENPLEGSGLFTEFDPAAAAVAAAHWLRVAANVAADQSGIDATEVVRAADDLEALPHESPTLVLRQLVAGARPHDVVTGLIRDAMAVAEGEIPNVAAVVAQAQQAERLASEHDPEDEELRLQLLSAVRAAPLDPARPALDLLEDLLTGIRGCWLIFSEYSDMPDEDEYEGVDEVEDDQDEDEEQADADDAVTEEFIALVRAAAEEERDQLL